MIRFAPQTLLLVLALVVLTSCGSQKSRKGGDAAEKGSEVVVATTRTLEGYWADFEPSSLLEDVDAAESRFLEWCALLGEADRAAKEAAIREFLELAVADEIGYYLWSEWAITTLYGLWSPVRDMESFEMFLRGIASDGRVPAGGKEFAPRLLGLATHNQEGSKAEVFEMFDPAGDKVLLSDFRGKRVLLLIVDTTCPSCVDTMQAVESNRTLSEAAQSGELALVVVAINQSHEEVVEFAEEKRGTLWRVFCTSGSELEKNYYDAEASPELLLLSHDGKVEVAATRDIDLLAERVAKRG
jgi:hypothetical protein